MTTLLQRYGEVFGGGNGVYRSRSGQTPQHRIDLQMWKLSPIVESTL